MTARSPRPVAGSTTLDRDRMLAQVRLFNPASPVGMRGLADYRCGDGSDPSIPTSALRDQGEHHQQCLLQERLVVVGEDVDQRLAIVSAARG